MGSIMHALLIELRQTRQTAIEVQAQWLADAAVERAAARLAANSNYEGESWQVDLPGPSAAAILRGNVKIKIERDDSDMSTRVVIETNYPADSRRRVRAERTVSIATNKKTSPASDSRKETNE
jgi:hypothetical protein